MDLLVHIDALAYPRLYSGAAGNGNYEKGKNQNILRPCDIDKIVTSYEARKTIEKYSYLASRKDITDNDYTLDIPRYVDTFGKEELVDINEVKRNIGLLGSYSRYRDTIHSGVFRMLLRGQIACKNCGYEVDERFADAVKTSPMPNGGVRELKDFALSRYAFYLIVMNGDPGKRLALSIIPRLWQKQWACCIRH